MLPDEQLTPEQIEIFRRMTPGKRLAMAESLFWTARDLKAAWLRSRNPTWSEDDVRRNVTRLFVDARS